jgi:hypothetical protein
VKGALVPALLELVVLPRLVPGLTRLKSLMLPMQVQLSKTMIIARLLGVIDPGLKSALSKLSHLRCWHLHQHPAR